MEVLLEKKVTEVDLSTLINEFIENSFEELEEDGSMCLDICEEEDSYHMTSYWVDGTYSEAENFLNSHYNKEYFNDLCDLIFTIYPNDIEVLKKKMGDNSKYKETLAYECLSTILLKKHQLSPIWYTVYGCEEEDLIDFKPRYNILNAYEDQEDFPVLKMSDLSAAMMGVSTSVTPSEMYDVFAYHADSLMGKEYNFIGEERKIFTPQFDMYEAVQSRWKNYVDMMKNIKSYHMDFLEVFLKAQKVSEALNVPGSSEYDYAMANQIKDIIKDDYYNRFSAPPKSLPLHRESLSLNVIELDGKPTIKAFFKIRGVEGQNSVWKSIMIKYYDIPQTPQEVMETIFRLAVDMKVELVGMEAQKATKERKSIPAIEGKYPRKNLSTHGLRFIDDMNVHYKDSRGNDCKKDAKARFSLAMAEKQALYIMKKMLRYSKDTTISCSFGVDSILALHLLRRITKNDFTVIFNNSHVEYKETYDLMKRLKKEWNLEDKLIVTKPLKSYWDLLETNGWNWDRKGDRREKNGSKKSNSEECCKFIKHLSFYKLIAENNYNINISGIRADESRARSQAGLRDGSVYYAKSWNMIRVNPILHFTDSYVWEYIKKYNVPYSEIYDMKLYYEDVYDNIEPEDEGKIYYSPRTGCWSCMVNSSRGYLQWLKKFKEPLYWHLMKDRGLAKTLFIMNAHKLGIDVPKEVKTANKPIAQISFFEEDNSTCTSCNSPFDDYSADDILVNYSVEMMEMWITRRPCKFMDVG